MISRSVGVQNELEESETDLNLSKIGSYPGDETDQDMLTDDDYINDIDHTIDEG